MEATLTEDQKGKMDGIKGRPELVASSERLEGRNLSKEVLEKIQTEQNASKANRKEVENQWRKILRGEKLAELQKEAQIIKQRHDEDVKKKDGMIDSLHHAFDHAEDQFHSALSAHLQSIDKLIDLHDNRLLTLEQNFEARLESTRQHYTHERKEIVDQYESGKEKIIEKMRKIENEEQHRENNERQDKQQTIEEIRNRNLEDINGLRFVLDSKIEDLEEQFDSAQSDYLQKNDQKTNQLKSLTIKDKVASKEIDQRTRKIDRLQNSIKRLKKKSRQSSVQSEEQRELLLERKNKGLEQYRNTRERIIKFQDIQQKKLAQLTKCANTCKSRLGEKCNVAERIVKQMEFAKRFETDQENNALYDQSVMCDQIKREAAQIASNQYPRHLNCLDSTKQTLSDKEKWARLDMFWKKYNNVLLSFVKTEKEVEHLKEINIRLKNMLQKYNDAISVNDNVIASNNPLFVINGRVEGQTHPKKPITKPLTVVDANHFLATTQVRSQVR
mmetsp:Transcript_602/g.773  ORF Transcript_602/g.773 Transcript_602/m.773 type:complete len:501 (+) Transcript_602:47-1549(+)